MDFLMKHKQGFEIHGSTGAPLPEKNTDGRKKIEEHLKKNPQKDKRGDPESQFCLLRVRTVAKRHMRSYEILVSCVKLP